MRKMRPLSLSPDQQKLLDRHPQLLTLHRDDWERAAAHLDESARARRAGELCSWCYPSGVPRWQR